MYNLYKVEHALGTFVGVARDMETAREHFGQQAKIVLIEDERTILEMRLTAPERIFLAI